MPSIFKRFMKPPAVDYVFQEASELAVDEPAAEAAAAEQPFSEIFAGAMGDDFAMPAAEDAEAAPAEDDRPLTPLDYARVQAEAIIASANLDAEKIRAEARAQGLAEAEAELAELKKAAHAEAYSKGYAEGMANAMADGRQELTRMAQTQAEEVRRFLDSAAHARELVINQTQAELRDLALAIAEKVVRVSLRSSADILLKMIETATEKRRRCEWVQIYIADCDAKALSCTTPELAAALRHLSDRVRIIPMADDESGTCIIEMPDEIIDASVSTQMENIREIVNQNPPGAPDTAEA